MGRPYVLINVAATVDGKIDTIDRRGAAISSDADRQRVERVNRNRQSRAHALGEATQRAALGDV